MATCEQCERPILAKGLCGGHYQQMKRGVPFTPLKRRGLSDQERIRSLSQAVGPLREAVRAQTQLAIAEMPIEERLYYLPVSVDVVFYLPRPKGHMSARGGPRPSAPWAHVTKPDIDKLARAVLDGLKAGGMFKDDNQVVVLRAEKQYADDYPPGALITVEAAL